MSTLIMRNGIKLYEKEKKNIDPLKINIFGDDFTMKIIPKKFI